MRFLGIDMVEWAATTTFIVGIGGLIVALFKISVNTLVQSLKYRIKDLTDAINDMTAQTKAQRQLSEDRYQQHEHHLEQVDIKLGSIQERLKGAEDDVEELKRIKEDK